MLAWVPGASGSAWREPEPPPLHHHPLPKEALPEHIDRTSTVAGPLIVCLGPVRSGAAVGPYQGVARLTTRCARAPSALRGRSLSEWGHTSALPLFRCPPITAPLRTGPRHTTDRPATVFVQSKSSGTASLGGRPGAEGGRILGRPMRCRSRRPGTSGKHKYGLI